MPGLSISLPNSRKPGIQTRRAVAGERIADSDARTDAMSSGPERGRWSPSRLCSAVSASVRKLEAPVRTESSASRSSLIWVWISARVGLPGT